MSARQSNAYLLSTLLHGTVVALVLLLGYTFSQRSSDTPKVFELVAAAGDNYAATEAPALGVAGGIKVTVPAPPAPAPEPAQVQTAPAPPVPVSAPAAPPRARAAVPAPPKAQAVPNFAKQVQRVAHRKAARLEAIYKAEEKKQESFQQFLNEQRRKAAAAHGSASTKVPKIDAEGIAEGVEGGSTANKTGGAGGKALTREEQDLLDSYFAMLKSRIRENYVPPSDLNDKLAAKVEFFISAEGSISRVRIISPSGSAEFDESVREAVAHTHVPAPPEGGAGLHETTFHAKDDDSG